MTVVKNYVVHVYSITYVASVYHSPVITHVILSEVPDCSLFSRINAARHGKILYLYILAIHDYYRPSSVVILILNSKVRSYGYVHVTGHLSCMLTGQLSCMGQDYSVRACDRTTVVLHVTGQQLFCMLTDQQL